MEKTTMCRPLQTLELRVFAQVQNHCARSLAMSFRYGMVNRLFRAECGLRTS